MKKFEQCQRESIKLQEESSLIESDISDTERDSLSESEKEYCRTGCFRFIDDYNTKIARIADAKTNIDSLNESDKEVRVFCKTLSSCQIKLPLPLLSIRDNTKSKLNKTDINQIDKKGGSCGLFLSPKLVMEKDELGNINYLYASVLSTENISKINKCKYVNNAIAIEDMYVEKESLSHKMDRTQKRCNKLKSDLSNCENCTNWTTQYNLTREPSSNSIWEK